MRLEREAEAFSGLHTPHRNAAGTPKGEHRSSPQRAHKLRGDTQGPSNPVSKSGCTLLSGKDKPALPSQCETTTVLTGGRISHSLSRLCGHPVFLSHGSLLCHPAPSLAAHNPVPRRRRWVCSLAAPPAAPRPACQPGPCLSPLLPHPHCRHAKPLGLRFGNWS